MTDLFPTTTAKDQRIFDAVMSAVNQMRRKGAHPITITAALCEVGIDKVTWNNSWARTRKRAPHMAEMLTRAITAVQIEPDQVAPEEEPVPEQPEPQEPDETAPTVGEVIDQVMAWVGKLSAEDRPRALAAAAICLAIPMQL